MSAEAGRLEGTKGVESLCGGAASLGTKGVVSAPVLSCIESDGREKRKRGFGMDQVSLNSLCSEMGFVLDVVFVPKPIYKT